MRVAVVCDAMTFYGGAERVVEQILQIYPQAELFIMIDLISKNEGKFLESHKIHLSFLQKVPFFTKHHRKTFNFWPFAVEQFDVSGFDVVISSHHSVANGVITRPYQPHISYVHSPMRYAWDLQNEYLTNANLDKGLRSWWVRYSLHKARLWDFAAAQRPDNIAVNSKYIKERVRKFYKRPSQVIYPPVEIDRFTTNYDKEDYYLTVGRLVPYKRHDLVIEAFRKLSGKKLVMVGTGPDYDKLFSTKPSNVEMRGWVTNEEVTNLIGRARALIYAGVEDFGITPVEAQAAGTPVIAFDRGGLKETIIGGDCFDATGVFFPTQDIEALVKAIEDFERDHARFTTIACRKNASRFSAQNFQSSFKSLVDRTVEQVSALQNTG